MIENLDDHDRKLVDQLRTHHGEIGILSTVEIDQHVKLTLQTGLGLVISLINNEADEETLKTAANALQRIIKALN